MDVFIKHNIIKKNKLIVDVGHKFLKLLSVHYSGKRIIVTGAQMIDSEKLFRDGELNFAELAKMVERALGKKKMELSVSVPSEITEYKIMAVKNKKVSELRTYIEKDHGFAGKVSLLTHELDYAYLGTCEENGDSVHYCLIGAVAKAWANRLTSEFEKRKLKVTTISFPINDLISLSSLFCHDYEHRNRLMIDFGFQETRIAAVCDGVPVYVRSIGTGFKTYVDKLFECQDKIGRPELFKIIEAVGERNVLTGEQIRRYFSVIPQEQYYSVVNEVSEVLAREIWRVAELCENNGVPITKVICNRYPVKGFENRLQSARIDVESFSLNLAEAVSGKNFTLQLGNANANSAYNSALGLALHTMW